MAKNAVAGGRLARLLAAARLSGAPGRDDDFLPFAARVPQQRHSPYATWTIYTLSALVVAIACWMHFARIDDVVTARGFVRPAGKAKMVSHPAGGRVAGIPAREGQAVVAGEPLVLLDDTAALRETARLEAADRMLAIEILRLEAETQGSATAPRLPLDLDAEVLASQLNLWRARQAEIASRRNAADLLVDRARASAAALRDRILATEAAEALLARQYADARPVAGQGPAAALHADVLRRELADRRRDLQALRDDLGTADRVYAEAVERRAIVDREWQSASRARLAEAIIERQRVGAALRQQEAVRRDLVLRAPIDGVVADVRVGEAALVGPGEPLVGVVAADQAGRIQVEALVVDRDVAAVASGQDAFVRPDGFAPIGHGAIRGTVVHVAREAASIAARSGTAFAAPARFVVVIALDVDIPGGDRMRLKPGMPAKVDLVVGQPSIIEFLAGVTRR